MSRRVGFNLESISSSEEDEDDEEEVLLRERRWASDFRAAADVFVIVFVFGEE